MIQHYDLYTAEDRAVWKILFERQIENLKDKACTEYLESLQTLAPVLNGDEIPEFNALSNTLKQATNWTIKVVPGIIPVDEFFELLSKREFCSSTWIRKRHELDYLEEPDMFHDIFGHIPLIMNQDYADCMEQIGKLGVRYNDHPEILNSLRSLYWFTIEFGLIQRSNKRMIYGAGILSSFGETNHIFQDKVEIAAFDIDSVIHQDFINSEIQKIYFELDSFDQLYDAMSEIAQKLEKMSLVVAQ